MKMKKEKINLIIWVLVSLIVGVIIGMLITNATIGNATRSLSLNNLNEKCIVKVEIGDNGLFNKFTGEQILYKFGNQYILETGYSFLKIKDNLLQIVEIDKNGLIKNTAEDTFIGCDCFYNKDHGACSAACSTTVTNGTMTSCSGSCSGSACSGSCSMYSITGPIKIEILNSSN